MALLFPFTVTTKLSAQNAKEDFSRIEKVYENAGALNIYANYLLYTGYSSGTLVEQQKSHFHMSGLTTYTRMGDIETVLSPNSTVIVDHSEKTIMLSPPSAKGKIKKKYGFNIDSVLQKYKSVDYAKMSSNEAAYTLTFQTGQFESIKMYFNTSSYFLTKVILYYRDAIDEKPFNGSRPRMEIQYDLTREESAEAEKYSEKKFFIIVKGKYTLRPEYKKYRFFNSLKKS
jgi:hypothetical protein